ncbi:TfoX/Sxy family protein [Parasalinivibrio latis]|uniref:TfoX/Sxy family DNA transformation protein n=1 Tax=Parasalinivibrio latis TaxID=2952610 RepID=UPI0030DF4367
MKRDDHSVFYGLGPKSVNALNEVGIFTLEELKELGSVRAYLRVIRGCTSLNASLNLLYGLEGAIESRDWRDIAQHEKGRLLLALEDAEEIERGCVNFKQNQDKK